MKSVLSCFGRRQRSVSPNEDANDEEPLLPDCDTTSEMQGQDDSQRASKVKDSPPPFLGKLVDVAAAVTAGKLPSQEQVSRFLQLVLSWEACSHESFDLRKDHTYLHGSGPTSKKGRLFLRCLGNVLQAALEFGMEKNDDNKLQDLIHQLGRVEASCLVQPRKTDAAQQTPNMDVKDQIPPTSEIETDVAILLHALRTLLQSILTSTAFRALILDALGILRDLAAQGAAEVKGAALQLHDTSKDVETDLKKTDIEGAATAIIEHVRSTDSGALIEEGLDAIGNVVEAEEEAKEKVAEKASEWGDRGEGAMDQARDDLILRLQQILVRAQEDPSARGAMRAILILLRKYSGKVSEAGGTAMAVAKDVVDEVATQRQPDVISPELHSYPPPSSLYPPVAKASGASRGGGTGTDPLDTALADLRIILERVARGHSLERLLNASIDIMRDLHDLPLVVEEAVEREMDGLDIEKQSEEDRTAQANVIGDYFARIGRFLDHILDAPGLVTSREGTTQLEELFDDGVEILNVVGEVVMQETGDLDQQTTDPRALSLRRKFRRHVETWVQELEAYVAELERDRSTMNLVRSLDELASATSDLFSSSGSSRGLRGLSFGDRVSSSLEWTEWIAWAIPHILRLVPASAVPIPSLEARSESGGWEAALYALFVEGEAQNAGVGIATTAGERDSGVHGGVQTTLVPDEIVFREWSEVRIDMTEEAPVGQPPLSRTHSTRHSGGRDRHLVAERSIVEPHLHDEHRLHNARINATSRVQVHVDGMRAKIDGLGYHVRYGRPDGWFGYHDEGILNVDVGMGRPHEGLCCDVELEFGSDQTSPSKDPDHHPLDDLPIMPVDVGEGIEGEGDLTTVSEYVLPSPMRDVESGEAVGPETAVVVEGEVGGSANVDVQRVLDGGAVGREREYAASKAMGIPYSRFGHHEQEELNPVFKVVDVRVQMKGVKVVLEQSRHWILNKLIVQPLAGPTVHIVVQRVLQEKVREGLERLAVELARLSRDVADQTEIRRERVRRQLESEGRRFEDDHRDSFIEMVEDWVNAIAQNGSRVLDISGNGNGGDEANFRVRSSVDATSQGLVFRSTSARVENALDDVPPMIFNKTTGQMEPLREELAGKAAAGEREVNQSDVTVAVGAGAQIFPDKRASYGHRSGEGSGSLDQAGGVVDGARSLQRRAEERFQEDMERERRSGWRSGAFDL